MSNLNIGVGLLRIHSVISRGLNVSAENSQSFAKWGYQDLSTKEGTFYDEMPPIVTQQLLPVVWKEKWKPKAPFLLP
jgi:hypothetical protein